MNSIVYFLVNPVSGLPFYIGIGRPSRPLEHFQQANRTQKNHKLSTIRKLRREGFSDDEMIRVVAVGLSRDEAKLAEEWLIREWGLRIDGEGPLTNLTYGGDGSTLLTPEAKAKCADWQRARWADPNRRAELCQRLRAGSANAVTKAKRAVIGRQMFSLHRPKLHASRMQEDKREIRIAAATKASMAAKEWLKIPENRLAISEKRKELWRNPEYRELLVAKNRARSSDPEYHEKICEAQRKRWANARSVLNLPKRMPVFQLNLFDGPEFEQARAVIYARSLRSIAMGWL